MSNDGHSTRMLSTLVCLSLLLFLAWFRLWEPSVPTPRIEDHWILDEAHETVFIPPGIWYVDAQVLWPPWVRHVHGSEVHSLVIEPGVADNPGNARVISQPFSPCP